MINLNDPATVLAATLYGSSLDDILSPTHKWDMAAYQNVAQAIQNRRLEGVGLREVCLAPNQFTCWEPTYYGRARMMNAPATDPFIWTTLMSVASDVLNSTNPDRIGGAKNFYPLTLRVAPPWARPPAVITLKDNVHVFVKVD